GRVLRSMLADEADIQIVGECRNGPEVVATVRELVPDLLFLDIQMPGLDGFGALEATAQRPVTVFVTAHKDHALRAFDVDAVDYLLKPFGDDRFGRALHRARLEVQRRRIVALASEPVPSRVIESRSERRSNDHARIAVRDGASV